jgi:hypothetical protein
MRRLLISFLLAGTLLAACGGGGGSRAASAPAKPAKASADNSVIAAGASATSTTSSTSAPKLSFSGNSGSSWCDLDRSLENSTKFQTLMKDPHAWAAAVNAIIPQVESRAPAAIRTDVNTLVGVLRIFMQALSTANYDFSKINVATAGLQDPKFSAASERITAYDRQVCGTKG